MDDALNVKLADFGAAKETFDVAVSGVGELLSIII